jgi:hypothetical protein
MHAAPPACNIACRLKLLPGGGGGGGSNKKAGEGDRRYPGVSPFLPECIPLQYYRRQRRLINLKEPSIISMTLCVYQLTKARRGDAGVGAHLCMCESHGLLCGKNKCEVYHFLLLYYIRAL